MCEKEESYLYPVSSLATEFLATLTLERGPEGIERIMGNARLHASDVYEYCIPHTSTSDLSFNTEGRATETLIWLWADETNKRSEEARVVITDPSRPIVMNEHYHIPDRWINESGYMRWILRMAIEADLGNLRQSYIYTETRNPERINDLDIRINQLIELRGKMAIRPSPSSVERT